MTRLTHTGLAGLLAALAFAGPARAVPADPSGTWLTQDGRARIRLEKCGVEQVCGYVVWMREPTEPGQPNQPKLDIKNPDPTRRSRQLLGHQLLGGLKGNADDRWEGNIYNNEDGKRYDVTLWLEGAGQLKLRGCLVAFLCSTQTWTRAGDQAPGQLAGATGGPNGPQPDREWARAAAPAAAPKRDSKPRS